MARQVNRRSFLIAAALIDLAANQIAFSIRRLENQQLANLDHGFVIAALLIEVLDFVQRLLCAIGLGGIDCLTPSQVSQIHLI